MSTTFTLDFDLLQQARAVGGDIHPDDRQTSTSETLPFYSVIGKNSKDSSYRGVLNGKSVEVSRAGEFKRKNEEGTYDFYPELELCIIDARTAYTIFGENKPVAKGISTEGFTKGVWTWAEDKVEVGTSCENSPYNRFWWERNGGKEGKVFDPSTGKVLVKEDLATCALQLWAWDVKADEWCIVQFSAGALRHYRDFVRGLETQGVKMHSLLWKLTSEPVSNGDNVAPSYIPKLEPIRVLTEDEFLKADMKRAELVNKTLALGEALYRQEALSPASAKALPAKSAFSMPPLIDKGPADVDPNDVFATVA
jgi:hypothetical protein